MDRIERPDLRRRRAEVLTHEVMRIIRDRLPHDLPRDTERALMYDLLDAFRRQGVEIITDYDRQTLGLPPRGPDGWTDEEIAAHDRRILEALTRPMPPIVIEGAGQGSPKVPTE